MSKELRLSQAATEMWADILDEYRNYNFDSINFQMLLYGVLNCTDEEGNPSPLASYLYSKDAYPDDVENTMSLTITDYCATLQEEYEKAHPETKADSENEEESAEPKPKKSTEMQPDFKSNLSFTDCDGIKIEFPANQDMLDVYAKLLDIIGTYEVDEIQPIHFIVAMFMVNHKAFKNFFKGIAVNYPQAVKHFEPEKILKLGSIPFALAGFMHTLNDKVDSTKPCEILMRDTECEKLWNIMLKKNKRNAVIVGEAGVGKTALIEKLTYDINKGTCPKEFKKFKVIVLDVNSLIAGTSYRGDAEERIKDVIEFLQKNRDVILFIDEVHTILGAGSCFEGEMDLANALKPILARGDTIVIGATTEEEYELYFQRDAALSRRFEKVPVKEPMSKDVYPMIKNKIKALADFHGVKIRKPMVEYAIMIASCFAFEKKNPDKTLDLLDRAMVAAKRNGKKYVDKDSILKNFGIFFKTWNNMSEESKKEVAYHEAGHYIVGKACGTLINHNWLAVSILPAEDYLGVTVYEHDESKIPFSNLQYFIDEIAFDLGGRVAENMFRKEYTSGASADLISATKTAYTVVSQLGMGAENSKNRIYLNTTDYPMVSEKLIDALNTDVDSLVDKATARATEILTENADVLEAIVESLLKHHIMSEAELELVWQKTKAQNA